MKKNMYLLALCLIGGVTAEAQLGNFANKVKSKIKSKTEQRIDRKVDKGIDETLDVAEGKKKFESNPSATSTNKKEKTLKSFSKFDFVPGEQIVYADDFEGDEMGELPVEWNTQGKAELVSINNVSGNWLRLFPTAVYLARNKQPFTKNFTVEFDLLLDMESKGYSYPYFSFGLLGSGDDDPTSNDLLKGYKRRQSSEIYLRLSSGGTTSTYMESYDRGKRSFITESQQLSDLENYYGKPVHVSIQVQESRLRVWFNGEKKFDLPKALPTDEVYNNLFFQTFSSSYKENDLGFYISNIKVATGIPDTRHKLIEEGKFSTTGILFDVNTATIKPESHGVLKEVGEVLKKNADLRISINGHTDSDGSDNANLELSKKRSEAVKKILVNEYKIDESRLEAYGKGESEPIGDNKTKEGKMQNRRVEFIKL